MPFKSVFSVLAVCAALSACAGGEPLVEGEKSILIGIPKKADCRLDGVNLSVEQNENLLGKGLKARGAIDTSILVCTNAEGTVLQTTGHRGLVARGPSANVIIYTIRPGTNRVSGTQSIRSQQFEFWADITFTPVT